MNQPQIGEFKNGRGELFAQESFNGRTIFVRFVWSDITPDSHHVEQSFSDDGGRTWEPNFVATLTRDEETSTGDEIPLPPASSAPDGAHDFDFHFGVWKTHIRRLLKPLTGSRTWTDYADPPNSPRWPLPPLRPKRAAYGVAGLRSRSGHRNTAML
jgi:hypothetical protein